MADPISLAALRQRLRFDLAYDEMYHALPFMTRDELALLLDGLDKRDAALREIIAKVGDREGMGDRGGTADSTITDRRSGRSTSRAIPRCRRGATCCCPSSTPI